MAKHYYISFNGSTFTEIFPVNNPIATYMQLEGTRVWREEVDEIKLTKTKNSSVYTTLASYFVDKTKFDTELEIEIYEGLRATGTLYFKGVFSISDSEIDLEYTTFKLKPRINDSYLPIIEKADIQYELDYLTLILETKRIGYSSSFSLSGAWTNPGVGYSTAYATFNASGGSILTATTGGLDSFGATLGVSGITNNDILILDVKSYTIGAGSDPTLDFQAGAGNTSMTDEGPKTIATGLHAFTAGSTQASPRLAVFSPACTNAKFEIEARKINAANDKTAAGELLMTFIENFLDSPTHMNLAAYTGNVLSTFFNNDALPSDAPSTISTWITAHPNGNYVSLTEDSNELNNTIIGLLIEWFSVTDHPSFKLSFNDIMGQLRETFQVYWYIDGDSKFRVEHEMYFVKLVADSTPIALSNYPAAETDARALSYDKARIASTEQFSWAQAWGTDFIGDDIIYNNFETVDNTLEHSVNYITTDIKYMIDNIDSASNSGFGLYQCNLLTGITGADIYEINILTGALSGTAYPNAAFSWANLHESYWTWSRMSVNATMNSVATTLDSGVRFLIQEGVNFYYATAINPFTMITTTLTGAAPIEIRRNLETDYVEMILGYDPYKL